MSAELRFRFNVYDKYNNLVLTACEDGQNRFEATAKLMAGDWLEADKVRFHSIDMWEEQA